MLLGRGENLETKHFALYKYNEGTFLVCNIFGIAVFFKWWSKNHNFALSPLQVDKDVVSAFGLFRYKK